MITFKLEGLEQTVRNLGELPKATRRNVVRRVLTQAGEPVADQAAQLAPVASGRLSFSIVVSPTLTRRQRGAKINEVEIYIGPAGGNGALSYASFKEFGTIDDGATPFMRPAWEANQGKVLGIIKTQLGAEIERAAARLSRKTARLAARA